MTSRSDQVHSTICEDLVNASRFFETPKAIATRALVEEAARTYLVVIDVMAGETSFTEIVAPVIEANTFGVKQGVLNLKKELRERLSPLRGVLSINPWLLSPIWSRGRIFLLGAAMTLAFWVLLAGSIFLPSAMADTRYQWAIFLGGGGLMTILMLAATSSVYSNSLDQRKRLAAELQEDAAFLDSIFAPQPKT